MKRYQVLVIIVVLSTGFNVWFAKRERANAAVESATYDHAGTNCNKVYQPKDIT